MPLSIVERLLRSGIRICLGHVQKRFLGQIKFAKLLVKTTTTFMILSSTHHIKFGWLGIGNVIQYLCIQVRRMKRETNQQSHMLFWPKMVSDGGVLLLEQHRNKVRFGRVQTGSAKSCHPLNFKPDHQSSSATGLNFQTGPGSGSARFRFELWFRTEPWHH